jgi:hypothetical protein
MPKQWLGKRWWEWLRRTKWLFSHGVQGRNFQKLVFLGSISELLLIIESEYVAMAGHRVVFWGAWQAPKVRAKIRGSLGFVLGNFHFKMLQRIEDI